MKNGSEILQTQSPIVLENLINKFFANFSSGSSSGRGAGSNSGNSNGKVPNQSQKPQEPHP